MNVITLNEGQQAVLAAVLDAGHTVEMGAQAETIAVRVNGGKWSVL